MSLELFNPRAVEPTPEELLQKALIEPQVVQEQIVPMPANNIPAELAAVIAPEDITGDVELTEKPIVVIDKIHFNESASVETKFNNGAAIAIRNRIRDKIGVDFRNTQQLARLIGEIETGIGIDIRQSTINNGWASIIYLLALTNEDNRLRSYIPQGLTLIQDQVYQQSELAIDWNPRNGDIGFGIGGRRVESTEVGLSDSSFRFTIGDIF
jgi:hypothetical protein